MSEPTEDRAARKKKIKRHLRQVEAVIDLSNEEWRRAPGFDGYAISNCGRFARILNSGMRSIRYSGIHKSGYRYCFPYVDGKKISAKVHRLVALAFIGDPPAEKPQVNHINGIRNDCRVENLEWMSNRENARHAQKAGLFVQFRGSSNGTAKLTEERVAEIKTLRRQGVPRQEVARRIGCNSGTVWFIDHGRQWTHVG